MDKDQSDHCSRMAEELEELRRQLSELNAHTTVTPPVTVVVQRERRLRSFDGKGDEDATHWCKDAEAALRTQNLIGRDAADYVWCHLEGPAKKEMACRTVDERCDAQTIFKILRDTFGERASVTQLLRSFYERKQRDGESIIEYSHELASCVDRLDSVSPRYVPNRDTMLRDQLVENVRESMLRWELKKKTEAQPSASFIEIRDMAVRWTAETDAGKRQVRAASQEAAVEDGVMAMLKVIVEQQQQLIRTLGAPTTTDDRRRRNVKGNCYQCGQPGHYARECRRRSPGFSDRDSSRMCNFCGCRGHAQHQCRAYAAAQNEVRNHLN